MARVSVQVPVEDTDEQAALLEKAPIKSTFIPRQPFTKKNLIRFGLLALSIVIILVIFVLMNDRKKLKDKVDKLSTSQPAATQNDTQKYQEEIGKIVELPTGQTPSLVTVSDAKKLASENPFFKNAQNGDVVLLYVSQDKSVRAILYRPSTQKIVEATSSGTVGSGTKPNSSAR